MYGIYGSIYGAVASGHVWPLLAALSFVESMVCIYGINGRAPARRRIGARQHITLELEGRLSKLRLVIAIIVGHISNCSECVRGIFGNY